MSAKRCFHGAGSRPWGSLRVTTVSPEGTHAIAVTSGNSHTGTEWTPSTRNHRGPATSRAVHENQAAFTAEDHPAFATTPDEPHIQTWLLLYYEDTDAHEVRVELSLPAEIESGYVNSWRDRLIFEAIERTQPVEMSDDEDEDEDDDLDIRVERR